MRAWRRARTARHSGSTTCRRSASASRRPADTCATNSRAGSGRPPPSTVPDLHRSFDTPEGPWTPRNDQNDYHDQVTLAKALAKSLNVATANLVQAIGPATVVRYAERFGLGRMKAVASIGLGSNEEQP